MNGVQRAEAHGVELYSRDLSTQLSGWYVKHAEGAARYFETMFGPLPRKVRMAQVWRDRSMGYASTAYTVLSEGGRSSPHVTEVNPGRQVDRKRVGKGKDVSVICALGGRRIIKKKKTSRYT